MNLNNTGACSQNKDLPTFEGRLYADTLESGGAFGRWVRRVEADALLDENRALKARIRELDTSADAREIDRLNAENARLTGQVDKWARFSERHGWLDPEDFDGWKEFSEAELKRLRAALEYIADSSHTLDVDMARTFQSHALAAIRFTSNDSASELTAELSPTASSSANSPAIGCTGASLDFLKAEAARREAYANFFHAECGKVTPPSAARCFQAGWDAYALFERAKRRAILS